MCVCVCVFSSSVLTFVKAEFLELNRTVLETMEEAAPNWDRGKMKALLGRFLFKGEDVNKKVSVLSGGEKARLAMAKFMATPATLLILVSFLFF